MMDFIYTCTHLAIFQATYLLTLIHLHCSNNLGFPSLS
jgi:hypothetical protein